MKDIQLLLTIILLTTNSYSQQQIQISNNHQNSYVDSAIFYFNKSETTNGIDSLVFEKGLRMMDSIPVDDNSIRKIQKTAEEFKNAEKFRYYIEIELSLYNAFLRTQQYYKAIDFGKELISQYEATQNADDRILFLEMLQILRIPFRVSDKLEDGFDYYTSKLKLYLQKNDSAAISICYYVHGGFYRTNGLNDLAIYYYKKSIPYLNVNDSIDGESLSGRSAWKNNTAVVGDMYNAIGDYRNAISYSWAALKYGMKNLTDSTRLPYIYKNIAFAKIMLNEPDSVIDLLNSAISVAKSSNSIVDIANSYLIKGIYYLRMNELDSSQFYLQQCNKLMAEYGINANSTGGILNPNYYLALGRVKQSRFKDAADLLKIEIPRLVNLREVLINEYKLLVEVYLNLGDFKNSNETFAQYNTLQEQLKTDERNNRKMSFEAEQKIADAESTITNLETEKHVASLTRNYLVGIVSLLLVIALFIYNRFRVKRNANVTLEEKNRIISLEKANVENEKANVEKEKERSDNLLLNILPAEVAEELKQTGVAKAKAFTLATVMFTDFKDFTNLSEKVSAELLVDEIHTCFSAFDNILQKHKIEKIKTIGDAYMCASGLPVPNYTHATDMLHAAFEIRDFMLQRKKEKEARGEIPFVLRIGIHTGPVVAGIVGIKKFAYDIWGDTVNIASRMESSGEAGKVNISGSTYELVKDKFNCVYRGKIEAKNKGEIDMYFVESISIVI